LLETGLPILLWPRRSAPDPDLLNRLRELFPPSVDARLCELPARLHKHRREQASYTDAPTCDFSLLWDNPNGLPDLAMQEQYSTDYV
jgi:hypothetical protein